LLAVNTADAKLEVFQVEGSTPVNTDAIPVGLDPVTVRARSNTEAWVVNHISDSVSIVDLTAGVVVHTLQTEDEPADVVFAGNPERAFVTSSQTNTVMVFDPNNLTAEPETIAIAGEDPRALAVSTDGNTVYAAIFESGNASTVVRGGRRTTDYLGVESPRGSYGGQNPPPNSGNEFEPAINPALPAPPRVSMIVKKDNAGRWMDDNNGDWTALVSGNLSAESGRINGWDMPDNDVAIINANTLSATYQKTLMNMVMGISVNPLNNRVVVVGTDALNEVRYEPNLKSHFVTSRYADFPATGGTARLADLNSHLDPAATFLPPEDRLVSIGDPRSVTWAPDGIAGYVTAMGSNSVVEINRNGSRRGEAMPVQVGQGPTASVVHAPSTRLFVLNRFEASISVVNFATRTEEQRVPLSFDPTPNFVNEGRRLLYDTQTFSGLGQVSCASCHVDARYDRLAWDLGNPAGEMEFVEGFPFHPMKGPMRTTSLIGVVGSPVLHFRGDKESLPDFSPTYTNLQGTLQEPTADEMNQLETFIATIQTPPNPFRELDNSMPQLLVIPGPEGRIGNPHNPSNNCARCHNPDDNSRGGLRNGGNNSPGQQTTTSPSLLSMYEILGFSRSRTDSTAGFAFIADGANDTQAGATLRNNNSLALMMAWNGDGADDTHAAVGKQVTFNGSETAEDEAILEQLIQLAASRDIGLVAHGLRNNGRGRRGFTYLPDTNNFQTLSANGRTTLTNLQSQATAEFPITFTAVPIGTEFRIGVDRDDDGLFDLDDGELFPPEISFTNNVNNEPAEDVLTNGTFANGLTGWLACGGQSEVLNGAASLTTGCIYQEFVAVPGAQYTATCNANVASGYSSLQLAISDSGFSALVTELTEEANGANGTMSASATAPATAANGVITLYIDKQGTFDNCQVIANGTNVIPEEPEPVVPVDPSNNLIANGNFADGVTNWQSCGGELSLSADSNPSLALSGSCVFQGFEITPGSTYEARCTVGSEAYASVSVSFSDANFAQLAISDASATSATASPVSISDTAPANSAHGFITLYADSDATFDDCTVIER
jgi:hypothetical protein